MPIDGPDDPNAELYRRLAWRIMPFLLVCYIVNYMDRTNIGFAKLQFLADLHLSEATFGLITSSFFISYVLCEIPSAMLVTRMGAPLFLLRIMVGWGLVTTLTMFAQSANMFYLMRILLGVAEAGFFPGVLFYMSLWFPDKRRASINSLFVVGIPLAGLIGGPVSGNILQHLDGFLGLRGWQWVFGLEGPPAIIMGLLALWLLADKPENARWLSEDEKRRIAIDRELDVANRPRGAARSLGAALRYPRLWQLASVYFSISFFVSSQIWFPTLLKNAGVVSFAAIGWITGGISLATAVGLLCIGRSSDRAGERRWHIFATGILAAAGYGLLPLAAGNVAFTSILLALGLLCGYSMYVVFWTLPPLYLEGAGAASGFAIVAVAGSIGSSLAPALVGGIYDSTGSLYIGLSLPAAILVLATGIGMYLSPPRRMQRPS